MKWSVFYVDTTFTSDDGAPEDAPLDGVQVAINCFGDGTREIVQGHDYYLWIEDRWSGGTQADLERWVRAGYVSPGRVKFGLIVGEHTYRQIVDTAMLSPCGGCT